MQRKNGLMGMFLAMFIVFSSSNVTADSITKPYTFTAGTTAKASEVNANFDTVYGQVNKIGGVINIDSGNSRVGIGTTSPRNRLHVHDPNWAYIRFTNPTSGTTSADGAIIGSYLNQVFIRNYENDKMFFDTNSGTRMTIDGAGNVGIGTTSPNYPLEMGSGAHVTAGGVWTNASSREYKENIRDLSYDEAKSALSSLKPAKFNYKVDKDDDYLGFIAEDVPNLVATKDRKGLSPMDIVAVLTKVVQRQQEEINDLKVLLNARQ